MPGEQGVVTGTKRRDAGPFAERTLVLSAEGFPVTSLRFRGRIPLLRPERIHASDVVMEKVDAAAGYCRFLPVVPAASDRQPSLYCIGGIIMWKNTDKDRNQEGFGRLTDVRVLTATGLLSAIAIVLGFFKIPLTQLVELRFGSLPVAAAGYLFGPVCAGAVGFVSDIGGYLVKPTGPFFPGFTLSSVLSGVIFGCVLYGKEPTLKRILLAQILYTIICGILLNSLWLSILYGRGFIAALTARLVKELVMIPVNTVMLAAIMQPVKRYGAVRQA